MTRTTEAEGGRGWPLIDGDVTLRLALIICFCMNSRDYVFLEERSAPFARTGVRSFFFFFMFF